MNVKMIEIYYTRITNLEQAAQWGNWAGENRMIWVEMAMDKFEIDAHSLPVYAICTTSYILETVYVALPNVTR